MKRHRVIVMEEAQVGIRDAFRAINEDAPLSAKRWLKELDAEIESLQRFPERCSWAREREYYGVDLRQLVYKSFRIIYFVDQESSTVYVLHVRHGKMRAAGEPGEVG